jgi:hypothetical protein
VASQSAAARLERELLAAPSADAVATRLAHGRCPTEGSRPKEKWLNRALVSAEIDRGGWRPSEGVDENRRTIEAIYRYYGRLFLAHPHLEWAGMANMIGPTFYAGFRDLGWIPDHVRAAVLMVLARASRGLLAAAGGDLYFYETTFLTMRSRYSRIKRRCTRPTSAGASPRYRSSSRRE